MIDIYKRSAVVRISAAPIFLADFLFTQLASAPDSLKVNSVFYLSKFKDQGFRIPSFHVGGPFCRIYAWSLHSKTNSWWQEETSSWLTNRLILELFGFLIHLQISGLSDQLFLFCPIPPCLLRWAKWLIDVACSDPLFVGLVKNRFALQGIHNYLIHCSVLSRDSWN